ncbi:MAG TPA: type I 3-dehydroquinate dehydratase [Chthoniobacterales bacterium]|nr:type I 3-dehydroquinate dehydratase [Chthoniobacterales bacterium]
MTALKSGKGRVPPRQTVAVISSLAELGRAARLRRLPQLFELRLDALYRAADELDLHLHRLQRPLILTARHPREGGHHNLSAPERRALLLQWLPRATYVDIELRSTHHLQAVVAHTRRSQIRLILSVHNFERTPSLREVEQFGARALAASADVIKLVSRVDTQAELERLISGFEVLNRILPTSAMGIGALGGISRVELLARGSVLNYAHLGTARTDGQLSLADLLRLTSAR